MHIEYFYSKHCGACRSLKEDFFPRFLARFRGKVVVEKRDIEDDENLKSLEELAADHGYERAYVPAVRIEEILLVGQKDITNSLARRIEEKGYPSSP